MVSEFIGAFVKDAFGALAISGGNSMGRKSSMGLVWGELAALFEFLLKRAPLATCEAEG